MRSHLALSALVLVTSAVAGGCSPAAVPARPSWDQDVFPILQGSCNHCHGELAGTHGTGIPPITRLDICDATPFRMANIMLPSGVSVGALEPVARGLTEMHIKKQKGNERPAMPPAPAAPLSDYERDILLKWLKAAMDAPTPAAGEVHASCRKQVRNRPPNAKLVSKKVDGDKLVVVFDVTDQDGDQVLGNITAGTGGGAATRGIPASGRRTFEFDNLPESTEIKVVITDGYEEPVDFTW